MPAPSSARSSSGATTCSHLADRRTRRGRRRGRAGCCSLAGEAGIGKTRLLGAIERRAADGRIAVAPRRRPTRATCEVAGAVLVDLARSLPGRRATTADGGAPLSAGALDDRAGPTIAGPAATRTAGGGIARCSTSSAMPRRAWRPPRPVRSCIALEDLHWADDLTLEILEALARPAPRACPILVVGTYRSDELYPADARCASGAPAW